MLIPRALEGSKREMRLPTTSEQLDRRSGIIPTQEVRGANPLKAFSVVVHACVGKNIRKTK